MVKKKKCRQRKRRIDEKMNTEQKEKSQTLEVIASRTQDTKYCIDLKRRRHVQGNVSVRIRC
jgi:hypothetical protein